MSSICKFIRQDREWALHSRPQGKFLMMVSLEMWIWTADQLMALDFRVVTSSMFEESSSRLFDDRRVRHLVSSFQKFFETHSTDRFSWRRRPLEVKSTLSVFKHINLRVAVHFDVCSRVS